MFKFVKHIIKEIKLYRKMRKLRREDPYTYED
jgi:hypothetical protein